MSDLISRQDAIDAIRKDMYADKDYMSAIICDGIEDVLNSLPSAQPEVAKDTNVPCKDAISIQTAIAAIIKRDANCGIDSAEVLKTLPSAQPEPKWKRLMMYLADLQLTYSPKWGANGCGDQKLYEFVTRLIDELQGWEEGEK